ncbi:MAG TPA: Ldh family oxidoreductase [Xanthobacteraceae bacterium]|nr:Ldh family oxidoreductase [Xanthobacteraceae bacterium]
MAHAEDIAGLQAGARINAIELANMVAGVLETAGIPSSSAEVAAGILVDTQLHGIDSHGIAHLPTYVRRLVEGAIETNPDIKVTRSGAVAVMDGGNGLGVVVARQAIEQACNLAQQFGIGCCSVRNGNHFGAALPLVNYAAKAGFVSLCFSNAAPTMAPWNGRDAILGTNPVAAAFPRAGASPIVIDMATSAVARGRIRKAARAREAIPLDWALDESGNPTSDANAALKGTVQPLAGAKGYALTLMVELLSTMLSGGRPGFEVMNPHDKTVAPAGVSHLFVAFDPQKFASIAVAEAIADRTATTIERSTPRDRDTPRLPGSRASAAAEERWQKGIPLTVDLIASLREAAALATLRNARPV